jgi:hypothetical protein
VMSLMRSLILICFVMVLVSEQDSCTVRAKRTKGQRSFWMHPMVLQVDEAQVEAHLGLFGDSPNLVAR